MTTCMGQRGRRRIEHMLPVRTGQYTILLSSLPVVGLLSPWWRLWLLEARAEVWFSLPRSSITCQDTTPNPPPISTKHVTLIAISSPKVTPSDGQLAGESSSASDWSLILLKPPADWRVDMFGNLKKNTRPDVSIYPD